jgi:methylated-DNA-[protein]-cysteine S-methyltransferase
VICYAVLTTPIGWCAVVTEHSAVRRVVLGESRRERLLSIVSGFFPGCRPDAPVCSDAVLFIERYFKDGPNARPPVVLDPGPATPFQRAVWNAAALIPFGHVQTYGWIAAQIGRPAAARAVGSALSRNPLPLIVPCHRVVRGDGALGGFFASGGTALKRRLLEHEGVVNWELGVRNRISSMFKV